MLVRVQDVNVDAPVPVPPRPWLVRVYLWACERLYSELAWAYDVVSWMVSAGQWRQWQANAWSEVRGQDVLEMGCGTGTMLVEGGRRGYSMVGVDRSSAMVQLAQRRVKSARCSERIVLGDGRCLPLLTDSFDSVVATFPAGYILEEETLRETRRILREGGRLVIVGLWVAVDLGGLEQLLPLFYGRPTPEALATLAKRVGAAGFAAEWKEARTGRFSVGLLVAEREP